MKVAFGKIDITPPELQAGKGEAAKIAMAGYSRDHYARGILDPLMVHAVLVEDTTLGNIERRFLFISIDTLKIPMKLADYIKEKIQKRFWINPNQVIVHATHTHQAPDLTGEFHWPGNVPAVMRGIMFGLNRNDKYMVYITYRILKMVGAMVKDLVTCKVAYTKTTVTEDVIINRRHPTRRSKSPLGIIAFKHAKTNELLGFIVNFTCHSTTLGRKNDKVSGDYPGRIMDRIEKLTRGAVKAVFFGGAGGDINPIATCGTDFEHLTTNQILGQEGTAKDMHRIGDFLGDRALQVAREIPDDAYYDKFECENYIRIIWVPLRDFTHYHSARPGHSALVKLQNRVVYAVKKYFLLPVVLLIAGNEEKEPTFPGLAIKHRGLSMHCYSKIAYLKLHFTSSTSGKRLDLSIFAAPGEPFEDIGNFLITRSHTKPENTLIFQHANDWFAYFFDLNEYIDEGGMEPLEGTTPVAGYHIKKEYVQLLDDIKNGLTAGYY
nr:neutral/alkaline non-lysosomal ceramidase N-terminal domain-containing protein [Candidatus Sigynarchaeum springense]